MIVDDIDIKGSLSLSDSLRIASLSGILKATSGLVSLATASDITGSLLTGLSTATNSPVIATDSILTGIGKLQAQINATPGTVTSVGLVAPSIFTVTGSPITSNGSLTFAFNGSSSNIVRADGSVIAQSTLTANQTITLTGVITGSGATSITTSIADNALTIAKTSGLQSALDSKWNQIDTRISDDVNLAGQLNRITDVLGTALNNPASGGNVSYLINFRNNNVPATFNGQIALTNSANPGLAIRSQFFGTWNPWKYAMFESDHQDLIIIEGLAGTGLLRKTGTNAWTLDSTSYLTTNQSISITGEATGSGATSINLTLTNSAVIGKVLTGFTIGGATTKIASTDSILSAFSKTQGQIDNTVKRVSTRITTDVNNFTEGNLITDIQGGGTTALNNPGSNTSYLLNFNNNNSIDYAGQLAVTADASSPRLAIRNYFNTAWTAWDYALLSSQNPDLVAIEALSGTSGLLRKTAANTWSLDTTTYANQTHTHVWSDITNGSTILAGYLPLSGGTMTGVIRLSAPGARGSISFPNLSEVLTTTTPGDMWRDLDNIRFIGSSANTRTLWHSGNLTGNQTAHWHDAYLPLTAGNTKRVTGGLYLDHTLYAEALRSGGLAHIQVGGGVSGNAGTLRFCRGSDVAQGASIGYEASVNESSEFRTSVFGSVTSWASWHIRDASSTREVMRLNTSGGLSIGTTTDPGSGGLIIAGLLTLAAPGTRGSLNLVSGAGTSTTQGDIWRNGEDLLMRGASATHTFWHSGNLIGNQGTHWHDAYLLLTGGTLTGKLNLAPSTTTSAGLNLGVAGTAPTTKSDGDIWRLADSVVIRLGTTNDREFVLSGPTQTIAGTKTFSSILTLATPGTRGSLNLASAAGTSTTQGDIWRNAENLLMRGASATHTFWHSGNLIGNQTAHTHDWANITGKPSTFTPGLTSGRVPFVTAGSVLTDSADFTYSSRILTITGTNPRYSLDGPPSDHRLVRGLSNGSTVWEWGVFPDTVQYGNQGWGLIAYSNGVALDRPILVDRLEGGSIYFARPLQLATPGARGSLNLISGTVTGATQGDIWRNGENLLMRGASATHTFLHSGNTKLDPYIEVEYHEYFANSAYYGIYVNGSSTALSKLNWRGLNVALLDENFNLISTPIFTNGVKNYDIYGNEFLWDTFVSDINDSSTPRGCYVVGYSYDAIKIPSSQAKTFFQELGSWEIANMTVNVTGSRKGFAFILMKGSFGIIETVSRALRTTSTDGSRGRIIAHRSTLLNVFDRNNTFLGVDSMSTSPIMKSTRFGVLTVGRNVGIHNTISSQYRPIDEINFAYNKNNSVFLVDGNATIGGVLNIDGTFGNNSEANPFSSPALLIENKLALHISPYNTCNSGVLNIGSYQSQPQLSYFNCGHISYINMDAEYQINIGTERGNITLGKLGSTIHMPGALNVDLSLNVGGTLVASSSITASSITADAITANAAFQISGLKFEYVTYNSSSQSMDVFSPDTIIRFIKTSVSVTLSASNSIKWSDESNYAPSGISLAANRLYIAMYSNNKWNVLR